MKQLLPILYARGENNKVLEWQIEVDGAKYRTITGAQGFLHVTSEWTVCEAKNIGRANATTNEEQAYKESKALWDKKISQNGYWENIKDIDKVKFFAPQLAHKWEDYKNDVNWNDGVYVSAKLDGLRSVFTKNGATSRNGKPFVSFPHILRELKPLFDSEPYTILDGEVYTHKLNNDFNKIISLAKKTKPKPEDLIESEKYLEYWVFDCPSVDGGFHERYEWLEKTFDQYFKNNKWIKLCPHKLIKSEEKVSEYLQKYIESGYEGLMVNIYDGQYEQKRSRNILKYKNFCDEEFLILDIIEGDGNRSGKFGRALLKDEKLGITFESNARGTEEFYVELLKNKQNYIGKLATVRYQNRTPGENKPRFPVIISIRNYE